MSKRKRLPPMGTNPFALCGLQIQGYTVGDWCSDQYGKAIPTAVAVSLHVTGLAEHEIDLVMRLKSPEAVDTMIQALLRHKRSVWPDAK